MSTGTLAVQVRFTFQQVVTYGIQVIAPFELVENEAFLGGANFEDDVGSTNGAKPCYSPSKRMSAANATFQPPEELAKVQGRHEVEILLNLKATDLISFRDASAGKEMIILGFFGDAPWGPELDRCALRLGNLKETLNSAFRVEVQLPQEVLLAEDTFPPPNEIFRT
jgi:hypothetical protein